MFNFLNRLLTNSSWHKAILFIIAVLLYGNTLKNEFVLDDNIVLRKNEFVKKGFAGMKEILIHDSFKGFFMDDQSGVTVTGGRYRPLTLLFFASLFPFFGLNPIYYHLINILLFAVLGLILYQTLKKLLDFKFAHISTPIAFLSSILFVTHPIHTEVVSNIKGLDEIFSLLFSMLSMLFCIRYYSTKQKLNLFLVGIFFLLAIFSKESAVNFLLLMPLAFILLTDIKWKQIFVPIMPMVLSLGIYFLARVYAIGFTIFNEPTRDVLTNPFLKIRGTSVTDVTVLEKLGMIFYCIGKYIQLLLIPHPLTHDYFPQHVKIQSLFSAMPFIAFILFITLIILSILWKNNKSIMSFSIAALLIPMVLVSNLIIPMGTPMGERFIFMASWGFCVGFSYLLYLLIQKNKNIGWVTVLIVLILFSTKIISRNKDWQNEYSLFSHDVNVSVNSIKAHSELAYHLIDKIKGTKDSAVTRKLVDEALPHLEKTVMLYPRHANAIYLIGNLNYLKKNYEKAALTYEKYLELVPFNNDVVRNLQICYREQGRDLAIRNTEIDKAIEVLIKSLKLKPSDPRLLESLGIAYGANSQFDLSIEYFNKAIQGDPKNGMILVNMANSYLKKGEKEKASEIMRQAYKLDPSIGPKLMTMQKPY